MTGGGRSNRREATGETQTMTYQTTYRLRVYTGPTQVEPMAEQFSLDGVTVTGLGTAHVYVTLTSPTNLADVRLAFLDRLRSAYGHTFCLTWRDVASVGHPLRQEVK